MGGNCVNGYNAKGVSEVSERGSGSSKTPVNNASHVENIRCLNALTKTAITIEIGSLPRNLTNCVEKDEVLGKHRLWPCKILKGCPVKSDHTGRKKQTGVQLH